MKTLVGRGRSSDFEAAPDGYSHLEEDGYVYLISTNFFCNACDGCGCKSCSFQGTRDAQVLRKARKR